MSTASRIVSLAVTAGLLAACSSCPPGWAEEPPARDGFLYAAASSGALLGPDEATVATTRALRVLADELGLDVERRLSVVEADGRLWVEAVGHDAVHDAAFEGVEVVDRHECDGRTHVLVRVPREGSR